MSKPVWIERAALFALVTCSVAMTAIVVQREIIAQRPPAGTKVDREVWARMQRGGAVLHDGDDQRVLVVFADYECPSCRRLNATLDSLAAEHPRAIKVVHRQFPLEQIHSSALKAALAAVCAENQGTFYRMHSVLYAAQGTLSRLSPKEMAKRAEVPNHASFDDCMRSTEAEAVVDSDLQLGASADINATPTYVYNRSKRSGSLSLEALKVFVGLE